MEEVKNGDDLLEIESPTTVQLPKGKKYELRKFSIGIGVKIKAHFGTREKWEKLFQEFDGEAVIYPLWLLLGEDGKKDFPNWEALADVVPDDTLSKYQMATAVAVQLNRALPGVPERLRDTLKKVEAQATKAVVSKLDQIATTIQ